jgi:hypothetical protein
MWLAGFDAEYIDSKEDPHDEDQKPDQGHVVYMSH